MFDCEIFEDSGVTRVQLTKAPPMFAKGPSLERTLDELMSCSPRGIVFDLSKVEKMSRSAIGSLVDAVLRLEHHRPFLPHATAVAVCGLSAKVLRWIEAKDLNHVLPIFANFSEVLADARFKSLRLQNVQSVLLCANRGARLAPLTDDQPAALLDFLGKPMAQHTIEHGHLFGLRNFVMNPSSHAAQITEFAQRQNAASVFCVNEDAWQTGASNDVATLARLHAAHGMFAQDTFVFQTQVLSNVDLAEMMTFHRKKKADATLAVTPQASYSACDVGVQKLDSRASAVLLSPHAVEAIGTVAASGGVTDIVPALRAAHLDVQLFISDHDAAVVQCGKDYFACQSAVLSKGAFGIIPLAEQIEESVWIAKTAQLDRRVEFDGSCFVGAHARIAQGSVLQRTSVVNAGCVVEKHAVLSNSILMANTRVAANTFVDHMIAAPNWAVNHTYANGSLQNRAPLDGLTPLKTVAEPEFTTAQIPAKIA